MIEDTEPVNFNASIIAIMDITRTILLKYKILVNKLPFTTQIIISFADFRRQVFTFI